MTTPTTHAEALIEQAKVLRGLLSQTPQVMGDIREQAHTVLGSSDEGTDRTGMEAIVALLTKQEHIGEALTHAQLLLSELILFAELARRTSRPAPEEIK